MTETLHHPVLIVIAGPNGSGKTTITSQILHHERLDNTVYINPNHVAQERFGDWNSSEAVRQAAVYCAEWRERCLADRQSMIKRYSDAIPQWAQVLM
ncbi:MAG: zeta toxin family protein [Bacteroidales bacterium]|nr:zeta toxin family protein [Bacteroidales bacterium]